MPGARIVAASTLFRPKAVIGVDSGGSRTRCVRSPYIRAALETGLAAANEKCYKDIEPRFPPVVGAVLPALELQGAKSQQIDGLADGWASAFSAMVGAGNLSP